MARLSKIGQRVAARTVGLAPIKRHPLRLKRSIVSFTFDDFPRSAWTTGGPILQSAGAKATFFVAGSLAGTVSEGIEYFTEADLREVHDAGHEIGNHTFRHWRLSQHPSDALLSDLDENERYVRSLLGDVIPATFAYPYGDTSLRTKALIAKRFACARGGLQGLNAGSLDLAQLHTVSIESNSWNTERLQRTVSAAISRPSWTIFITHDLSPSPSKWGSTPEMLSFAMECCKKAGLEVLTIKNALARACFD